MFAYSASVASTILRECLENLEQSNDLHDANVTQLRDALLLRIAETEAEAPQRYSENSGTRLQASQS